MSNSITKLEIYLTQLGGRNPVFVKLHTQDGITGMGEAGIAYGVGSVSVCAMIQELGEKYLLGRSPWDVEAFFSKIHDLAFWSKGGGAIIYSAVSALELAMWDLQGKTLQLPVYQLAGGKVREKIRVYANGWTLDANTPDEYAVRAKNAVEDGHIALKMYPFTTPVGDKKLNQFSIPELRTVDRAFEKLAVQRVRAVREAIGDEIELMIDMSSLLTPDAVIHFARQVEDSNILWLEEPAEPQNLSGLQQINQHCSIPLATGERLFTRYGMKDTLLSGAISFIQPDLGNCGGMMEARKIASFAEPFGLRVALHNCASPYLTAVSSHLAACIPNFYILECFNYLIPEHYQVVDHAPEMMVENGFINLNDKPGFGITLDDDWLSTFLWK